MFKKIVFGIVILTLTGIGYYFLKKDNCAAHPGAKKLSTMQAKAVLDKIYAGISGFGIAEKEVNFIKKSGGAATYGEIKFDSAQKLLDYLKPTKDDVFYDLGSGVGKFVIQTYLTTDVKKSCGIELSGTRYELAVKALATMEAEKLFDPLRDLRFKNANIITSDFSDATIIFLCSTCYSDELMQKITDKFQKLKPGVKIASLREFKNPVNFKKIDTLHLPMTWSESSPVYIYITG